MAGDGGVIPAEELRQAAATVKERAAGVMPGDWDLTGADKDWPLPPEDVRHMATWSPAVALVVAVWLEKAADQADWWADNPIPGWPASQHLLRDTWVAPGIEIARLVNGSES